jgi:hypothetical protein
MRNFTVEYEDHKIDIKINRFTGKEIVLIDDVEVSRNTKVYKLNHYHDIEIRSNQSTQKGFIQIRTFVFDGICLIKTVIEGKIIDVEMFSISSELSLRDLVIWLCIFFPMAFITAKINKAFGLLGKNYIKTISSIEMLIISFGSFFITGKIDTVFSKKVYEKINQEANNPQRNMY